MPNASNLNATLLTKAELTELHVETVSAASLFLTLVNITRRAATLLEDSYQIRSYDGEGADLCIVESPEGAKYVVWHGAEVGYACSCPCFEKLTTCKHLLAVDAMKQDEADAARLDAMADEADYDRFVYRY